MMPSPYFAADGVTLYEGECLDLLRELADDSIDSVVTDPPYGIGFMGHEWDQPGDVGSRRAGPVECPLGLGPVGVDHNTTTERSASMHAGRYDLSRSANASFGAWCEAWARECLRVLKPGGYIVAFGGSRTWHRLASGIEDAGFELRDSIAWLYGSGFPKSLNIGDGRGTALKPSFEPIVVGRKPLIGTVAANVAEYGTGALNIDACRTATVGEDNPTIARRQGSTNHLSTRPAAESESLGRLESRTTPERYREVRPGEELGRWPANVALDEDQAAVLDKQTGVLTSGANPTRRSSDKFRDAYGTFAGQAECTPARGADAGGASRFFPVFRYEAKAPTSERPRLADGTAHPTVKPLAFMQWLVRLVTPPGGTVLDLFLGSGTTAEACVIEGYPCIGFEREEKYLLLAVEGRLGKPIAPAMFGEAIG
jgi:DNA modification methylase